MSEAKTRIWAFHDGPWIGYFVGQSPGEGVNVAEYIRADLVEAAIKRALEASADVAEVLDDPAPAIRALDPAQFIEEPGDA